MSADTRPFWESKSLDSMSDEEWESLCDGCGRCCLQKLEDEDSGEIHYTSVSCQLLDMTTCRCSDYSNRFKKVSDCLSVRPLTDEKISWLPASCAYRKLSLGEPLESWHPLLSDGASSVKKAGISMIGRCINETKVPISEYSYYLIEWDNNTED